MYADTVRPSLRASRMMAACWAGVTRMLMFLSFNFGSLVMAVRGRGCLEMYLFCSPSADNLRYRFDLLWFIKA